MDKLKPCPFCGGSAKVVLCDDEGNLHDEDYALRPCCGGRREGIQGDQGENHGAGNQALCGQKGIKKLL